jgi:Trk K+ transport system NAD-binding subunit
VPLALAVVANPRRAEALSGLGAHVVCPTTRAAHVLHLALVRSGVEVELVLGELALCRVEIPPRLSGRTVAELGVPGELLVVAVERGPEMLLASPDLALRDGDVLHVAATDHERVSALSGP